MTFLHRHIDTLGLTNACWLVTLRLIEFPSFYEITALQNQGVEPQKKTFPLGLRFNQLISRFVRNGNWKEIIAEPISNSLPEFR